jgi:hypothetical protein
MPTLKYGLKFSAVSEEANKLQYKTPQQEVLRVVKYANRRTTRYGMLNERHQAARDLKKK